MFNDVELVNDDVSKTTVLIEHKKSKSTQNNLNSSTQIFDSGGTGLALEI
jgi:hypothetical protein